MKLFPIVLAILCAAENLEKKAARQERNRLEREQKRNEQKTLRELARKEAKSAEKKRKSEELIQARGIPVDDSFGIAVESDIPGTTREKGEFLRINLYRGNREGRTSLEFEFGRSRFARGVDDGELDRAKCGQLFQQEATLPNGEKDSTAVSRQFGELQGIQETDADRTTLGAKTE